MSIEVIYQGLTIAKGPSFRLQDGGVFVELDGPMPVATALSLAHGEHALHGRVRRVSEGSGAGMLIVPTETKKLPRWLVQLGPTSVTNVELEPEPVVAAPAPEPAVAPVPEPAVAAAPESTPVAAEPAEAAPAATPTEAKSEAANAEPAAEAGEPAAASGHTPSEHDAAAKDDEEESKPTDKKPSAAAPANKKKKARKR